MLTKKQDKYYNSDVSSFDIIASIILISLGIILFSYCIFSFIMFNEIINMNEITYPSFGAKDSFGAKGFFSTVGNQQTITTFLKSIITYPMSVILLFYNYCIMVNDVKNVSMSTSTNIHNINMKEYTNKLIGTWYNVNVENSNLYIYQNSDIILKESQNLKFVKGYIDYDKMVIYTNSTFSASSAYGSGTNNFFNISHLNYVNNMYTFMILFDNNSSNYSVYSKYGYFVNIDTIKKLYITSKEV
jgi:hypothetical protein